MYARLFSVQVVPDGADPGGILVWGIDLEDEAVTFRRDPDTRKTHFGIHEDADGALAFHGRCLPDHEVALVWEDDWDDEPAEEVVGSSA